MADVATPAAEFRQLSAAYGDGLAALKKEHDAQRNNRLMTKAEPLGRRLRDTEEGRDALVWLLNDAHPYVRLHAYVLLAKWMPDEARREFERLENDETVPWQVQAMAILHRMQLDGGELDY